MNESTALVRTDGVIDTPSPTMIRPVGSPSEILEAWRAFEDVKRELLGPQDYQHISGGAFVKRSGWRKIAAAFGISTTILREECEHLNDGRRFIWTFWCRATAPNGRWADGVGRCDSGERHFSKAEHDVPATACTRAMSRAISDLVGGGEVSAEELQEPDAGYSPAMRPRRSDAPRTRQEPRSAAVSTPRVPWEQLPAQPFVAPLPAEAATFYVRLEQEYGWRRADLAEAVGGPVGDYMIAQDLSLAGLWARIPALMEDAEGSVAEPEERSNG